jgi:hypothetical protein
VACSSFKAFASASSPSRSRKVSSIGRSRKLSMHLEMNGFNEYLPAHISHHSPLYLDEIYLVLESSCNDMHQVPRLIIVTVEISQVAITQPSHFSYSFSRDIQRKLTVMSSVTLVYQKTSSDGISTSPIYMYSNKR